MSGVVPKFKQGPVTYEVVETVLGGQLVEARTGSKAGVAAAGSTKVLGVAATDAAPVASLSSTDAFGRPVLNTAPQSQFTAVYGAPYIMPVTYAAAALFGKALKAAALGQVTPWVSGTDAADLIIGYCAEPAGVSAGATIGLAKLDR